MLRTEETDEELMALYQEGSDEAFQALYSRHSGKIFGYLKSRTRSAEKATDLFQEVFVKIHRSKHLYNRSLPVLPWIFSITRSVLVDAQRYEGRKREVFDYDFEQVPSQEPTDDRMASVTPLMKALPTNEHLALQMRYVDEKTFEEIAARLKTSPVNARQIISRGVSHLRRLVTEKGDKP